MTDSLERRVDYKQIAYIMIMFVAAISLTIVLSYMANNTYVNEALSTTPGQGLSFGTGLSGGVNYAIYLVVVGTIIGIITLKFRDKLNIIFRILEFIFISLGCSFVLTIIFANFLTFISPSNIFYMALGLGISIAVLKNIIPHTRNATAIMAGAGTAVVLGLSFGFYAMLLIVAVIAVYDYVAVYITKHMVAMANAMQGAELAFMVGTSQKKVDGESKKEYVSRVHLGLGDIIFPAMVMAGALCTCPWLCYCHWHCNRFYHKFILCHASSQD